MPPVTSPICLPNRSRRFTRREFEPKCRAIEALDNFLQRHIRSFFKEKRLGGREDQFAVFLRVTPEDRFINHNFPFFACQMEDTSIL
jgi:hypothetical protein